MRDGLGREIDYLRISVTDKCNLRCKYCMPPEGVTSVPHEEVLTLEEILRLVGIMEQLGIRKVRLTGGEPMVRKNLLWLVEQIHRLQGIEEIAMTTNGTMFAEQAEDYRKAGLTAVNISLDTLDPERFRKITGVYIAGKCVTAEDMCGNSASQKTMCKGDKLREGQGVDSVVHAIDAAIAQNLQVKINCVPCLEMSGEDIESMAGLARDQKIDVRFIELMPIGCGREYTGLSSEEILARLERAYGAACKVEQKSGSSSRLEQACESTNPVEQHKNMAAGTGEEYHGRTLGASIRNTDGPAEYYHFPGFIGRIGFISPISHKFCRECNRIRLTCEGRLKLCLHYDRGLELKPLLRGGASDEEIKERILAALQEKPAEHHFRAQAADKAEANEDEEQRKMVQIGG